MILGALNIETLNKLERIEGLAGIIEDRKKYKFLGWVKQTGQDKEGREWNSNMSMRLFSVVKSLRKEVEWQLF